MIEIRIHGRGGQGGVTLAKLIATSRFLQGLSVQAFGLYAAARPERRCDDTAGVA